MEINILYEDKRIIVCEKPRGMLSQAVGSSGKTELDGTDTPTDMVTALDRYLYQKGEHASVKVVHRLDRGVGGVMVYAKDSKTAARLSSCEMKKEYAAICHGNVAKSLGDMGGLSDLLFVDSSHNKTFVVKRERRGVKRAELSYSVEAVVRLGKEELSLLSVKLKTGRTHQIRVQFSSRGFPLVGDGKYGSHDNHSEISLFSKSLSFSLGEKEYSFSLDMPTGYPWELFTF